MRTTSRPHFLTTVSRVWGLLLAITTGTSALALGPANSTLAQPFGGA